MDVFRKMLENPLHMENHWKIIGIKWGLSSKPCLMTGGQANSIFSQVSHWASHQVTDIDSFSMIWIWLVVYLPLWKIVVSWDAYRKPTILYHNPTVECFDHHFTIFYWTQLAGYPGIRKIKPLFLDRLGKLGKQCRSSLIFTAFSLPIHPESGSVGLRKGIGVSAVSFLSCHRSAVISHDLGWVFNSSGCVSRRNSETLTVYLHVSHCSLVI